MITKLCHVPTTVHGMELPDHPSCPLALAADGNVIPVASHTIFLHAQADVTREGTHRSHPKPKTCIVSLYSGSTVQQVQAAHLLDCHLHVVL